MQGVPSDHELQGVIPRSFSKIFQHIRSMSNRKYLTHVSYYEIYNEEVRDLLAPVEKQKERLEVKEKPESGFYVKDLSLIQVKNEEEMMKLFEAGNRNRSVGATLMNEQSSRSHSIFTINIESCEANSESDEKSHIIAGKLCMVDLAGSERSSKSGASGERLKEAAKINLSLSALGNCISALVDGKSSHIPYRDSKLTKLLQDSLGGNAKTAMIATISPAGYNYDETVSTLRYASRTKNIKNKPKINQDPKDALLKGYQEEIERLKAILAQKRASTVNKSNTVMGKTTPESNVNISRDVSSAEKEAIEKQRKLLEQAASEKDGIARELSSRQTEIEIEKRQREELLSKLNDIESKVVGGKAEDLSQQVNLKKSTLETQKKEIESKKQNEKMLKNKLGEKEAVQSQIEGKYSSLQEEIDAKTKKLKKLFQKYDEIKAEKKRISEEFAKERLELQDTIHELTKELSLKESMIDNFIPPEVKEDLEARIVYSEETNSWILKPKAFDYKKISRPKINSDPSIPPLSLSTRFYMSQNNSPVRYKPFNLMANDLEMPSKNF